MCVSQYSNIALSCFGHVAAWPVGNGVFIDSSSSMHASAATAVIGMVCGALCAGSHYGWSTHPSPQSRSCSVALSRQQCLLMCVPSFPSSRQSYLQQGCLHRSVAGGNTSHRVQLACMVLPDCLLPVVPSASSAAAALLCDGAISH